MPEWITVRMLNGRNRSVDFSSCQAFELQPSGLWSGPYVVVEAPVAIKDGEPVSDKGVDLRLMSSLSDASGIPAEGKDLIIVAAVGQVLHFRVFDGEGKVVVDTSEEGLPAQAQRIEELRGQLQGLWPPHELTRSEKERVIPAVTSIVGHTPGKRVLPFLDAIGRRLMGFRFPLKWSGGRVPIVRTLYRERQADLWFVVASESSFSGSEDCYFQLTDDEVAGWLEANNFEGSGDRLVGFPEPTHEAGLLGPRMDGDGIESGGEPRPDWDELRLSLIFRGVVCLQGTRKAERRDAILGAFQGAQWIRSIPSPFTCEKQTRDTIDHLNARLTNNTTIRFASGPGARVILWRPADRVPDPRCTALG
jgi:hypothetical protein